MLKNDFDEIKQEYRGDTKIEKFIATCSDGDSMNNVFMENGNIYRGINNNEINSIFSCGLIDELISENILTPSELASVDNEKYYTILSQPELLPPSDIEELTPSIRRDMGLKVISLCRILYKYNYALLEIKVSDFYINEKAQPVFHNLENIVPNKNRKFQYTDFHSIFLGPLRIVHEKPELAGFIQRSLYLNIDEDISLRHVLLRKLLGKMEKFGTLGNKVFKLYYRIFVLSQYSALIHIGKYSILIRELVHEWKSRRKNISNSDINWINIVWDALEKELKKFEFSSVEQRWTAYYDHLDLDSIMYADNNWSKFYQGEREQAILNEISDFAGGTLLDVGANNGYFSMLGAYAGFNTTALDYDMGAIDHLYSLIKAANYPLTIRPFIFNFSSMKNNDYRKYKSDVVFALGFVHHMRLVELLPWSTIAERLSRLTNKVLITEFKPGTGAGHSKEEKTSSVIDDYDVNALVYALKDYFNEVKVLGDYSATGFSSKRTMIVCRH